MTLQPHRKVRVLVVDDSALVRKVLCQHLDEDPGIEVVGAAPDPYVARDMIVELEPDVLTLDIEMPRMDGITFLKKLMALRPMPVIVVSSVTPEGSQNALAALAAGAVEVVAKPDAAYKMGTAVDDLCEKVRMAATVRVSALKPQMQGGQIHEAEPAPLRCTTNKVVAIGSSTGGTEALRRVLPELPRNCPGVLIVQHMPANFTKSFAEHLNQECTVDVKEADSGDSVVPGRVLIAPGDRHMTLRRSGARYLVSLNDDPPVSRHRPSADVLFRSVAKAAGRNAVGVIMTGMGSDGAAGLLEMKEAGAPTIGQDEASCVVYGMPRKAAELGAVDDSVPLQGIAGAIVKKLREMEPVRS